LQGRTKDDQGPEALLIPGPFKLPDKGNCYHNHFSVSLTQHRVTDNVTKSWNSAANCSFYMLTYVRGLDMCINHS